MSIQFYTTTVIYGLVIFLGKPYHSNRQVVLAVIYICVVTVNLSKSNFDQNTHYFKFVVVLLR
jgi:hypothetical protein